MVLVAAVRLAREPSLVSFATYVSDSTKVHAKVSKRKGMNYARKQQEAARLEPLVCQALNIGRLNRLHGLTLTSPICQEMRPLPVAWGPPEIPSGLFAPALHALFSPKARSVSQFSLSRISAAQTPWNNLLLLPILLAEVKLVVRLGQNRSRFCRAFRQGAVHPFLISSPSAPNLLAASHREPPLH